MKMSSLVKNLSHLVWHFKCNPRVSFCLLSLKMTFFLLYLEKMGVVTYLLQSYPLDTCISASWASALGCHLQPFPLHVTLLSLSIIGRYGLGHTPCGGLPSIPPEQQVRMCLRFYCPVGDNSVSLQGTKYFSLDAKYCFCHSPKGKN